MKPHKYLFLSYSRKDGAIYVRRLIEELAKLGIQTWRDEKDLNVYKYFDAEIEDAIINAASIVVCVTPDINRADSFVRLEVNFAIELNKPIIPLIFINTRRPITLMNFIYIDFSEWDSGLSQLIKRLEELIDGNEQEKFLELKYTAKHWGEIPSGDRIYGRDHLIDSTIRTILKKQTQLLAFSGIGGIGKTSTCIEVLQRCEHLFDYVVWVSLTNAPYSQDVFREVILFLSDHQIVEMPNTSLEMIRIISGLLMQKKCLVVLDNFETMLHLVDLDLSTSVNDFFMFWNEFCKYPGSDSLIIITTRELPFNWRQLQAKHKHVKSITLDGISENDAIQMLRDEGLGTKNSDLQMQKLIDVFNGHPLALKLAISYIRDIFENNIDAFLDSHFGLSDMTQLLEEHFQHTTEFEKYILIWSTIERQPISIQQIQSNLVTSVPVTKIVDALESLIRKSLLIRTNKGFTVQPVIMEFLNEKFINKIATEFLEGSIEWFDNFFLLKAQTKEFIRNAQRQYIIEPLLKKLTTTLDENQYKDLLINILKTLQKNKTSGYAATNILMLILASGLDVNKFSFSGLSIRQAYLVDANLQGVNFRKAHFKDSVFKETFGSILGVAFHPNGNLVAGATDNGQIRVWDTETGSQRLICEGHSSWVYSVTFTNDGKHILSGGEDQTVRIWDSETGIELKKLLGHTTRIRSIVTSTDGLLAASAGEDGDICIWDIDTGYCLQNYKHEARVWRLAFVPSTKILLAADSNHTLKFWDIESGECKKTLNHFEKSIRSFAISPNGFWYASVGEQGKVQLWSIENDQLIQEFHGHKELVRCIDFSPDNDRLVTAGTDREIRIWDIKSGETVQTLEGHQNWLWGLAYSPDGNFIVSGGNDQTIRLWDVATGKQQWVISGFNTPIWAAVFHPRKKLAASGGDDRILTLWDTNTWTAIHKLAGHTNRIHRIAFNPIFDIIATGGDDGTVRIWDIHTGKCLRMIKSNDGQVYSVCFSSDGQFLAVGGQEPIIRLYDPHTGQTINEFSGHTGRIWTILFGSNDATLISAGDDKKIRIWNITEGKCISTLEAHTSPIWRIAFSTDKSVLVSASEDHTVRIWSFVEQKLESTLTFHTSTVRCVDVHPFQPIIASAGDDRTIFLYDYVNNKIKHKLHAHSAAVYPISFSADGKYLLSGSEDQTLIVWDADSGEIIKTLHSEFPYSGMDISESIGLSDAQYKTLVNLGALG